ncbi:MAG: hypothetical protein JSV80_00195 [Acidobacteriota bacterium]|nr:MAG: hypothetical protein JSV80_00195 [Acidobacteriota bacterium]
MFVALATCFDLPDWEVDDQALRDALSARGVRFEEPAWNDPRVDWSAFDACLIRTTWDYMEQREAYLAWAERVASVTPLYNPPQIVRWNTHKSYLAELATKGLPVTPTIWLAAGARADVGELMKRRGWTRGFIKPMVGATARETLRFEADELGLRAAQSHLDRTLVREGMMLQPYLPSVESEGEISLVFVEGALTHAVRKIPVPGDYRVQDDFGAADEPYEPRTDESALARRVLESVDPSLLYARVDFLRDSGGQLRLSELELVEPSMFFRHGRLAAERLADGLIRRMTR